LAESIVPVPGDESNHYLFFCKGRRWFMIAIEKCVRGPSVCSEQPRQLRCKNRRPISSLASRRIADRAHSCLRIFGAANCIKLAVPGRIDAINDEIPTDVAERDKLLMGSPHLASSGGSVHSAIVVIASFVDADDVRLYLCVPKT
jgi:hypothetical protein